ncbi:sterol desaturase family protein [Croceitalea sp. MTPC9]|uniref:sterol desaturase family protein n=1 Tax=unclassified Croceitalea TaxID=2632280 RepID=UPI002B36FDAA|nr:sterol desaturase family protein [Croceitalea sp. MTPC6]GMN18276.1 sterol desaturase family protein [Croceitalea sp. MTPC9]
METYAAALLYAIPFFTGLVLVEVLYGALIKNQKHNVMDTVSSLSSGLTNIIKDSLGLVLVLVSYPFLVENLSLFKIEASWFIWVVAFIAIDFAGYWNHRLSHHVNIFWNQHVIHHSSEEFNLACALRQSISNVVGYFALLLIPAAILGVPNEVIAVLAPIHLFAQFWYHTQHIGKLGWLEHIIVTPSQHRVHHAINPEYIDKNLGQILCVWDRWFGTFQEELDEVPPQYGVLKPAATWNPILINFQHFWQLLKDAWRTKNVWDKFRIWFMPTGWRPKDVAEQHLVLTIKDVYNFNRYKPKSSLALKGYSIFQLLFNTGLLLFMLYNYSEISFNGLLVFSAVVFVGIFSYTSLMDRKSYTIWIEVLRSIAGLLIVFFTGDWFGLNSYLPLGSYVIAAYFLIGVLCSFYFTYLEEERQSSSMVT